MTLILVYTLSKTILGHFNYSSFPLLIHVETDTIRGIFNYTPMVQENLAMPICNLKMTHYSTKMLYHCINSMISKDKCLL